LSSSAVSSSPHPVMRVRNTFLCFFEDQAEAGQDGRRASSVPPSSRLASPSCPERGGAQEGPAPSCPGGPGSPRGGKASEVASDAASTVASPSLGFSDPSDGESVQEDGGLEASEEGEKLNPVIEDLLAKTTTGVTTIMVQNIPPTCTQQQLLQIFWDMGFANSIDLFYLPMDFSRMQSLGYCFLNLCSAEKAASFRRKIQAKRTHLFPGSQRLLTTKARLQGFANNFHNFRNSRVMGRTVPPEFQPTIINPSTDDQLPFPPPTRKLRKTKKTGADQRRQGARQRLAAAVGRVADERWTEMIVAGIMKGYEAPGRKAELEALVEGMEKDARKLQQVVSYATAQICAAAGWGR